MRRTIIAGLVAFALIATVGTAMATWSEIRVDTYQTYGGIDASVLVFPDYTEGDLFYQMGLDINWGENIGTSTYIGIPGDDKATIFDQDIEADEVKDDDGYFGDMLSVAGVGSPTDNALHRLEVEVDGYPDPYNTYPTVANDLEVLTHWETDGDTGLLFAQGVYVDEMEDDQLDAFGNLWTQNIYTDYIYQLGTSLDEPGMWGSTLDLELLWLIGPGPEQP